MPSCKVTKSDIVDVEAEGHGPQSGWFLGSGPHRCRGRRRPAGLCIPCSCKTNSYDPRDAGRSTTADLRRVCTAGWSRPDHDTA